MMNKMMTKTLLALTLLVTSTCAPVAYARHPPALAGSTARPVAQRRAERQKQITAELFIRTELFFGTKKPDGTEVTEEEWDAFLDTVITPEFPDGLTVLTGLGQFRGSDGIIVQERSMVLILLYPRRTRRESGEKIERIRTAYEQEFQQQSVLRADDPLPVWVSF